jgi:hypothetical protein
LLSTTVSLSSLATASPADMPLLHWLRPLLRRQSWLCRGPWVWQLQDAYGLKLAVLSAVGICSFYSLLIC